MFGQFALLPLPDPLCVDGAVVDGVVVVVDGVVVAAAVVPFDAELLDDEPVAAFAMATTLPAIAPVASMLAMILRSLITSPPFVSVCFAGRSHLRPAAYESLVS